MHYLALKSIYGDYYNHVHQLEPMGDSRVVIEIGFPMAGSDIYISTYTYILMHIYAHSTKQGP